jgi:hypothetical protein
MTPDFPGHAVEPARCTEVIRGPLGYERCHRHADHEPQLCHVKDRAWSGSWSAGTAHLRFGVPCDDGCVFGEDVSVWGGRAEAKPGSFRHRSAR